MYKQLDDIPFFLSLGKGRKIPREVQFLKCKSLYPLLVIPANLLRDVARLAGCLATHVHWDLQRARAATVQQHAAASLLLHSNTSLLAKKEYK